MAVQSEIGHQMLVAPSTVYQAALAHSAQIRTMLRADPTDPSARWYDPSGRRLGSALEEVAVGARRVPHLR